MRWRTSLLVCFSVVIVMATMFKAKTIDSMLPFFFVQCIFYGFVYFAILGIASLFKK